MSGHTPGPWKAQAFKRRGAIGVDFGCKVLAADGVVVAEMFRPEAIVSMPNAELLAAAPDLLAALRELDKLYAYAWDLVEPSGAVVFNPETVKKFERLHAAAQRALAKAEGRTPEEK